MKRTIQQEFQEAMDELCFTQQEKTAMVQKLIRQAQKAPKSFSGRKLLVLSLAAVLILSTMTAAAVYTRWPKSTEQHYQFSEQEKAEAQKSGLSVLPQETTPSPINERPQVVSATDQGVTISVVQTLTDPYRTVLVFRIEGFDLPEGEWPSMDSLTVTMDGRSCGSYGAKFFNGIVERSPDVYTYVDGSPLESDESGIVSRPVAADGSLEYIIGFSNGVPQSTTAEITATVRALGIADGLETEIPLVEGNWELSWTLNGADQTRAVELEVPIGDTGFILHRAELSSLTAILEMEGDDHTFVNPYTGELQEHWIPVLRGVMLKDGTFVPKATYTPSSENYPSPNVYLVNEGIHVADVDQIASLVFYSKNYEWVDGKLIYGEDYIIPIS